MSKIVHFFTNRDLFVKFFSHANILGSLSRKHKYCLSHPDNHTFLKSSNLRMSGHFLPASSALASVTTSSMIS